MVSLMGSNAQRRPKTTLVFPKIAIFLFLFLLFSVFIPSEAAIAERNQFGCLNNARTFLGSRQPPQLDFTRTVSDIKECHSFGTYRLSQDSTCDCKLGWSGSHCEFKLQIESLSDSEFSYGAPGALGNALFASSPTKPFALRWGWVVGDKYEIIETPVPGTYAEISSPWSPTNLEYFRSRSHDIVDGYDHVYDPLNPGFRLKYPTPAQLPPGLMCLTLLSFEVGPNMLNTIPIDKANRKYQAIAEVTILPAQEYADFVQTTIDPNCELEYIWSYGGFQCMCDPTQFKFGPKCQFQFTKLPDFKKTLRVSDEFSFVITASGDLSTSIIALQSQISPVSPVSVDKSDPNKHVYTFVTSFSQLLADPFPLSLTELKPEFLISSSTQIYVDFPIGVASIVQDVIPLNSI